MNMALSSSTLADCQQKHVGKGHPSVTKTYEIFEEYLESAAVRRSSNQATMVMSPDFSSDDDLERSKGSTSSMGKILQHNIKSWCEATGLPTTITIHFKDRSFQLHKFPLISRSGYLKRMLMDAKEVTIPDTCPGDPEILEIVVNFCYGSAVQMESSNVADLMCASEYLQMNEAYGEANLFERSDKYLNQVALQSWQDTMVVLLRCRNLYPYAEDLGIVSRCVECLAFLACAEMVEPLEKTSRPEMSIESQFWSDISVQTRDTGDSSAPNWWMDDLLRLPCGLFERVIAAIRREGMQEKYVSQAIVKFVDRWVFTSSCPETDDAETEDRFNQNASDLPPKSSHDYLVQAVVRLLPEEKDAVPISFLFSLLRCALACNSSADCKSQLEFRIASQLELATISDFLYPFKIAEEGCISAAEVSCMRRIVNSFMSQQRSLSDPSGEALSAVSSHEVPEGFYCAYAVSAVAKVWDEYLAEVARDLTLTPSKFAELAEVVPSYARATHDHLYRAIHVYLKVHPHFSQEERQMVCGILNCQKLSPEMCSHAVQNELMPLRMIVQAMFMQQLQTSNALSGHLQYSGHSTRLESLQQPPLSAIGASCRRNSLSFRIRTESFRSSRESFRIRSRNNSYGGESFEGEDDVLAGSASLGFMVKREAAFRQAALLKADFDATETRLQNLEEELAFMKKKINGGNPRVSRSTSERFNIRKKRKESLKPVPEIVTTSDNDDDHEAVGDVTFTARAGNGMGFITRVLRLITLGGFRRRKAADVNSPGEDSVPSDNILCGGRGIWRNCSMPKIKREQTTSSINNLVVKNTNNCASETAVKVRHSRRHSIS